MSRVSFENFGRRARADLTLTEKAGRHEFQRDAEARIVLDVSAKLRLGSTDRLLEIGCGTGNLLLSLAPHVAQATGVDHPDCLSTLRARPGAGRLDLIPGNFLDMELQPGYSRVLIYSVIHYLSTIEEVKTFVRRASELLAPGGLLLVGDIPNEDLRQRFLATPLGKEITAEHERLRAQRGARVPQGWAPDPSLVRLDDASVSALADHLSGQGLETQILPQPADLPFGHTREDLLVARR